MNRIKIFQFLLLILVLISVYFNYKTYRSYELQAIINYDIKQSDFTKRDMYFLSQIDDFYPSLNIFAMPLKGIKGKYLLSIDSTELGLKYLKESIKDNPYLMFNELTLAEHYYKERDFLKYRDYTYKIIENLPNNPVHFVHYARLMKFNNQNDSILYHFEKIRKKLELEMNKYGKLCCHQ